MQEEEAFCNACHKINISRQMPCESTLMAVRDSEFIQMPGKPNLAHLRPQSSCNGWEAYKPLNYPLLFQGLLGTNYS